MPYQLNLRRNMLALSFHFDLAHSSGRALGLNHAARFVHDLNVERENHHVLWLKYSYPLRQLVVELEQRLIASDSLEKGDVFFLQAPELIEAARNLPAPLPPDLIAKVKNRRRAYLIEPFLSYLCMPDLTVLLTAEHAAAGARINKRSRESGKLTPVARMVLESKEFFHKRQDASRRWAMRLGPVVELDTTNLSPEEMCNSAWSLLTPKLTGFG